MFLTICLSRIADTGLNASLVFRRAMRAHAASPEFVLELSKVLFEPYEEAFCRPEMDPLEGGLVVQGFDGTPMMGDGASDFQDAELPSGMIVSMVHAVRD